MSFNFGKLAKALKVSSEGMEQKLIQSGKMLHFDQLDQEVKSLSMININGNPKNRTKSKTCGYKKSQCVDPEA